MQILILACIPLKGPAGCDSLLGGELCEAGTHSVSTQCSARCRPYSRAQWMILEWMARPFPGIQGSPGSDLLRSTSPCPSTQLFWALGLSCITCYISWTFSQAALNQVTSFGIYQFVGHQANCFTALCLGFLIRQMASITTI